MRLLVVSDTVFDDNGVSRFIQDMASESLKKRKELTVLTSSPIQREEISSNIINLKPFLSFKMPFYHELFLVIAPFMLLLKTVKELQPDLLHISTPGPIGMMALYASWRYSIPFASTYHTDFPSYIYKITKNKIMKKITTWYMRFFYKKAQLVLTRSNAYTSVLKTNISISGDRIRALQAGTDTDKFHPKYKTDGLWSQYGIKNDSIKLLYVGRLSVEKNFEWLLSFFMNNVQLMREKNIELVAVGHGKILKKSKEFEKKSIHLLGIKRGEELSRIYASSDIFITPSVTETLGQVVLEAMASKLPCIVTNEGGPSLFVTDKCGYILEFGDDSIWLEALIRLADSKELREKMSQESFQRIKKFSIESSFDEFWEIHYSLKQFLHTF